MLYKLIFVMFWGFVKVMIDDLMREREETKGYTRIRVRERIVKNNKTVVFLKR